MTAKPDIRPALATVRTAAEFERWYWPVAELKDYCLHHALARTGVKEALRQRVAAHLAGAPLPPAKPVRRPSRQKGQPLTPDTVIGPDISFGTAVRGYFKAAIGPEFRCTSDFMRWMRANPGRTFADAAGHWQALHMESRTPGHRREIDRCNNYLQYLRDLRDAHPRLSIDQAKTCWHHKSRRPALGGYVVYDAADLQFLKEP